MEAALLRPTNADLRDPRYWLAHCEGFELHDAAGFLGWVEELEAGVAPGSVRALLVSPAHVPLGSVRVPARAVRLVVPEHGLVLVGSAGDAATRRDFFCVECGYGVGGASPPPRCPMCAGASWELAERVRRSE
jgi:hypothetical protein